MRSGKKKIKEKVLVTGGEGYIGNVLSNNLSILGYDVTVIDDNRTSFRKNLNGITYFKYPLQDRGALGKLFSEQTFDAIFHLAASAYVRESVEDPVSYFDNNLSSTISLIDGLKKSRQFCPIIFSSSCAVYGECVEPISEEMITKPINPYGMSKLMCEQIITEFCNRYNTSAVFLRFFNVAGADTVNNLGEQHEPETHVIPLLLRAGAMHKKFNVYGTNYETSDGTAVRDFIHVLDLVDGLYKSLLYCLNRKGIHIFNLGDGKGSSLLELIKIVKSIGLNPDITFHEKRQGDPPKLLANNSKAKLVLGWKPKYNVNECIEDAHNFFLKNNLYGER